MSAEQVRLDEAREGNASWKKWGPYLSERQWGTVREDYSETGDAWNYFTHDQARSRAYHWGEDGIAGFSDDHQRLCFALALWNGKDAILKERLFGLTNSEGNHGEDVKEYYFYLDGTPASRASFRRFCSVTSTTFSFAIANSLRNQSSCDSVSRQRADVPMRRTPGTTGKADARRLSRKSAHSWVTTSRASEIPGLVPVVRGPGSCLSAPTEYRVCSTGAESRTADFEATG